MPEAWTLDAPDRVNAFFGKTMDFFLQPLNLGLLVIMLISGAMLVRQVAQPGGKAVSPQAAIAIKDRENGVFVDVREEHEVAVGHIKGSLHLPLKTLADNLAKLEKYRKKPVVVICAAGQRSAAGTRVLLKAGFEDVCQLDGGIQAWEKAGLPLVRGSTKG
ncbi:MAG: rhodanese-like domain-containing protein [Rhodocyclaceae bacterium]|nr:rhodanese-like domain-containing protein [Rhodocyclaceae bacterium]